MFGAVHSFGKPDNDNPFVDHSKKGLPLKTYYGMFRVNEKGNVVARQPTNANRPFVFLEFVDGTSVFDTKQAALNHMLKRVDPDEFTSLRMWSVELQDDQPKATVRDNHTLREAVTGVIKLESCKVLVDNGKIKRIDIQVDT